MKKLIVSAFALALISSTAFATANVNFEENPAAAAADEKKEQVAVDAIPAAIKNTLAADAYKGWEVKTAWLVKGTTEYYVIELAKDGATTSYKFDKEGKQLS